MQIIFSTGEWIAQKINLEEFNDEMLFDPEINIDLGCWYINYLKERFSNDFILMISGYNAGPGTAGFKPRVDGMVFVGLKKEVKVRCIGLKSK